MLYFVFDSGDKHIKKKRELKDIMTLISLQTFGMHKHYSTNLGAAPRFASTVCSGFVLYWLPLSYNFKNSRKIIDQAK